MSTDMNKETKDNNKINAIQDNMDDNQTQTVSENRQGKC